jgi:hypothetical protein
MFIRNHNDLNDFVNSLFISHHIMVTSSILINPHEFDIDMFPFKSLFHTLIQKQTIRLQFQQSISFRSYKEDIMQ